MVLVASSGLLLVRAVGLASGWSFGGHVRENDPADAHDARLPPLEWRPVIRAVHFAKRLELRGPRDEKTIQLMLMMLVSRLLNGAQSFGQWVLPSVWSFGGHVTRKRPS